MPDLPTVKVCTHIKVTGVRCGSPALRGERFCYFHQRMLRGVPTPPNSRLHPIAIIENEEAIQASLMEVINALARNTIDLRRGELLLRALNTAVRNVHNVRFNICQDEMVREVPTYPAQPQPAVHSSTPAPSIEVNAELRNPPQTSPTPTTAAAPNASQRKPPGPRQTPRRKAESRTPKKVANTRLCRDRTRPARNFM